jgi:hypothetical protein
MLDYLVDHVCVSLIVADLLDYLTVDNLFVCQVSLFLSDYLTVTVFDNVFDTRPHTRTRMTDNVTD